MVTNDPDTIPASHGGCQEAFFTSEMAKEHRRGNWLIVWAQFQGRWLKEQPYCAIQRRELVVAFIQMSIQNDIIDISGMTY